MKDVQLQGPNYVRRGENLKLRCNYDTESESLYALKWYRESEEFYRYVSFGRIFIYLIFQVTYILLPVFNFNWTFYLFILQIPKEVPAQQVFPLSGIVVDVRKPDYFNLLPSLHDKVELIFNFSSHLALSQNFKLG